MRRAANPRIRLALETVMPTSSSRARAAAQVALNAAYDECRRANFDPFLYLGELTNFVSQSMRDVVWEISVDLKTADPGFVYKLTMPATQDIYFADGGRRAAQALLRKLQVSHSLSTTQREIP
jgi:hypothetical protein